MPRSLEPASGERGFLDALAALARSVAGQPDAAARVLSQHSAALLLRVGDVVAKAHAPDSDFETLARRLSLARRPELAGIFLTPLRDEPLAMGDRLVSFWPAAEPARNRLPWREAGQLLAALHAVHAPQPSSLPPGGAEARWARAVARLEKLAGRQAGPAREIGVVRAAADTLGSWVRDCSRRSRTDGQACLVHGDWHLGQLLRVRGEGWRLIDIDDLGIGDPAWDLARAAAFFAVGLLPAEDWNCFAASYRDSGGRAFGDSSDWNAIDVHARALTVQCAASAIVRSEESGRGLDESELRLIEGCRRMVRG